MYLFILLRFVNFYTAVLKIYSPTVMFRGTPCMILHDLDLYRCLTQFYFILFLFKCMTWFPFLYYRWNSLFSSSFNFFLSIFLFLLSSPIFIFIMRLIFKHDIWKIILFKRRHFKTRNFTVIIVLATVLVFLIYHKSQFKNSFNPFKIVE